VARRLISRTGREDGQATVEFAIILPVMLLLIAGIVQFGLVFETGLAVAQAAKAGAQEAALGGTAAQVQAAALAVTSADGITNATVSSEVAPASLDLPAPGVEVTVSASVPVLVPGIPGVGSTIPVSTTTVMLDDGPGG
jgi:Flp pilus assembly protein TadG